LIKIGAAAEKEYVEDGEMFGTRTERREIEDDRAMLIPALLNGGCVRHQSLMSIEAALANYSHV
jgi:hypothetical protein